MEIGGARDRFADVAGRVATPRVCGGVRVSATVSAIRVCAVSGTGGLAKACWKPQQAKRHPLQGVPLSEGAFFSSDLCAQWERPWVPSVAVVAPVTELAAGVSDGPLDLQQ